MFRLALHFRIETRCRNCDVDCPKWFTRRVEHWNSNSDNPGSPLLMGVRKAGGANLGDLLTQDLDRMDRVRRRSLELNAGKILLLKITRHVGQDSLAARGRVKRR